MDLELQTSRVADADVVSVAGELDALAAPQLDDYLAALVAEQPTLLILDLSAVTFLDSTGLGVVIKALKHVREHGGEVAAVYTSPRVAKVFEITGIDQAMAVGESVEAVLPGRS
ncbi:MAG: STAS domain-containing protein [Candidatus Nanopelagicales bacterium]